MSNEINEKKAILFSDTPPDAEQEKRFKAFLHEKYGQDTDLIWEKSDAFPGGFRLEVDEEIYDWSVNGRFQQLNEALVRVPGKNGNIPSLANSRRHDKAFRC